MRSIGGFVPPDCDDDLARHAIFALDCGKGGAPIAKFAPPAANARIVDMGCDIGREGRIAGTAGRARLSLIQLDHPLIGRKARCHALDRRFAYSLCPSPRHQKL
jgi:hypothetical protein